MQGNLLARSKCFKPQEKKCWWWRLGQQEGDDIYSKSTMTGLLPMRMRLLMKIFWPKNGARNTFCTFSRPTKWIVVFDNHIQINFGTRAKCTMQKHNAHCNQLELWLLWGSRHTSNSSGSISPAQLLLIPVSWGTRLLIVGCSRGGGGAVEILRDAIGIMAGTASYFLVIGVKELSQVLVLGSWCKSSVYCPIAMASDWDELRSRSSFKPKSAGFLEWINLDAILFWNEIS